MTSSCRSPTLTTVGLMHGIRRRATVSQWAVQTSVHDWLLGFEIGTVVYFWVGEAKVLAQAAMGRNHIVRCHSMPLHGISKVG
jgi:hypothetical protein